MTRWRALAVGLVAVGVFGFSWLFRFNDPGGSFAGLSDDHYFYLVRGWQILFGDLPVRDFVDHGAPLFYYVGAAVQLLFGRGTLSELAFCTTALALGASLTFWLCTKASGSIWAGLAGCLVHIWLLPRFYNYPKVLVYVAAIALLWWFADRPGAKPRAWIAVVTVIGFLFRHDHGLFVGFAAVVLMVSLTALPWRERLRHVVVYGALVAALVAPYLLFIQVNGGLLSYFRQASTWAERDREREPMVWPGLFDNPDGVSDEARQGSAAPRAMAVVRDNGKAWMYYLEIVLPFLALGVLALSPDAFRRTWPRARVKLAVVAVLAVVLDAGFLRSPLEARLADPSVPLVILLAWLIVALPRLTLTGGGLPPRYRRPIQVAAGLAGLAIAALLATLMTFNLHRRLDQAAMTDRFGKMFERVGSVSNQLRLDWNLQAWLSRENRPDLITLSMYVDACTAPTDRVFVQPYLPQVLALARRAFAGGHADLRPLYFSADAQPLVLSRLRRQPVPILLLDTGDALQQFFDAFPLIKAYVDEQYQLTATHVFDGRFGISLFSRRDLRPVSTWRLLDWPCYR